MRKTIGIRSPVNISEFPWIIDFKIQTLSSLNGSDETSFNHVLGDTIICNFTYSISKQIVERFFFQLFLPSVIRLHLHIRTLHKRKTKGGKRCEVVALLYVNHPLPISLLQRVHQREKISFYFQHLSHSGKWKLFSSPCECNVRYMSQT